LKKVGTQTINRLLKKLKNLLTVIQTIERLGKKLNNRSIQTTDAETLPQKIGEPIHKHKNETDHKLAETFGTNRQYIADIRKVRESEPETFEAIKRRWRG